jgi:hypothetical protein
MPLSFVSRFSLYPLYHHHRVEQAMDFFHKVGGWLAPPAVTSEDRRDQWPSRAAFLLAAMGGSAGQGNLLRHPSVLYNNYDLQWFIPYLLAVVLIAIPALILEVSIGQAYRGGTVIAFNNINRRLKGVSMGPVIISFLVVQYFTVNLAWIMNYFRWSFTSPLPWKNPSTARNLATTSWTVSIDGSQRGFDLRRLERGVQRDDSVPMA